MNILITGSNGFVGSKLMWRLQEEGHSVIGIDISNECNSKCHPDTHMGDIRIASALENILSTFRKQNDASIDIVIHCAAAKHDFGILESEYYSHNETGTKVLIDFVRLHQIKKLVYFSTVSVFGHPLKRTDEDGIFAPDHPYGASKLAGEKLCSEWQKQDPTNELIVLLPTVIYGPSNYANMYKLINMMHRHPYLSIGKGDYIKSIVSLANIIDMTIFSLSIIKPGAQYFNCVDKPYITVRKLMELIAENRAFTIPKLIIPVWFAVAIGKVFDIPAKLLNIDIPINSDRMRKLATATDFASERIREAGYIQLQSTKDAIKETTDWYLSIKDKRKL